jgi:hypothetical protein
MESIQHMESRAVEEADMSIVLGKTYRPLREVKPGDRIMLVGNGPNLVLDIEPLPGRWHGLVVTVRLSPEDEAIDNEELPVRLFEHSNIEIVEPVAPDDPKAEAEAQAESDESLGIAPGVEVAVDAEQDPVARLPKIANHDFEPGDHAVVEEGHGCHDCGAPLEQHARIPDHVRDMIISGPLARPKRRRRSRKGQP